ncbi:MAG: T9SS type A sorting domain-containing protein [Bacteroidota bacterium]|nr:T9SS type A sorting domain-containing protein [Bacteroidota bacterium]
MIIKNIAFFIFILVSTISFGQSTFEYVLRDSEDQVTISIFENNSKFIYCSVLGENSSTILKLNEYGVLADSIRFENPGSQCEITDLCIYNDNSFAGFGGFQINNEYYLWYLNLDYNLNVLSNYKIPVNYKVTEGHAILNSYGNFVFAAGFYTEGYGIIDPCFFEIEADGHLKRHKHFIDIGFNIPSEIIEDTTNMVYKVFTIHPLSRIHCNLTNLDSAFNIVSGKMIYPNIEEQNSAVWLNDSVYLLSGKRVSSKKSTQFDLSLLKLNNQDSIIQSAYLGKEDTVDWPAIHDNLAFTNKNSIFYASYLCQYVPDDFTEAPSWIQISNFDEDLNLQWQRLYGGDAYYIPYAVCATYDSGLLIASSRYDWNIQDMERDVHILKVNKEGLIVGTDEKSTFQTTEAILYPNPGNELINIWISGQYKNTRFQLFDMKGKIIIEEIISGPKGCIHVEQLKPGPYLFRIFNHDGLHEEGKWIKK